MMWGAVFLWALAQAKTPLFSADQIQKFQEQTMEQRRIPADAVEKIFNFYQNNRLSTGGLSDVSCIDKKQYRIRHQDPKLTKASLKRGIENETCLCVMDYTSSKSKERGHCIFLESGKRPVIESFVVAHGSGSIEKDGCPTTYTNSLQATGTTLTGFHLTAEDLYTFNGKAIAFGKYQSTGLGLYGVEESNWTASAVGKVTHGAPYVIDRPGRRNVGRSLGCPAMTVETAQKILPRCKGKAAWLNYTFPMRDRKTATPLSCSTSRNSSAKDLRPSLWAKVNL